MQPHLGIELVSLSSFCYVDDCDAILDSRCFRKVCKEKSSWHRFPWLSFAICLYHLLPLDGPTDGIQCPHRTDEDSSMLVGQHWCVHVLDPTRELCIWIHPCYAQHVLFILLGCFAWWEASSHTGTVLCCAASRTWLKFKKMYDRKISEAKQFQVFHIRLEPMTSSNLQHRSRKIAKKLILGSWNAQKCFTNKFAIHHFRYNKETFTNAGLL